MGRCSMRSKIPVVWSWTDARQEEEMSVKLDTRKLREGGGEFGLQILD